MTGDDSSSSRNEKAFSAWLVDSSECSTRPLFGPANGCLINDGHKMKQKRISVIQL